MDSKTIYNNYGNSLLVSRVLCKSHDMNIKKNRYESPCVLSRVNLELESQILAASVANTMTVETVGQEVETYGSFDGTDNGFNHEWK